KYGATKTASFVSRSTSRRTRDGSPFRTPRLFGAVKCRGVVSAVMRRIVQSFRTGLLEFGGSGTGANPPSREARAARWRAGGVLRTLRPRRVLGRTPFPAP